MHCLWPFRYRIPSFSRLKTDKYISGLIQKGIVPGISILVGQGGHVVFKKHYGSKSVWPETSPLEEDTIYDLASLTKPLITAFLGIYLLEKSKLNLGDEARFFIAGFPLPVTLLQLLTHTAGLPAWYPFYLYGADSLSQLKTLKSICRPGRRLVYSCPGYMLLYHIVNQVSGRSLEQLAAEILFQKLGLKNTFLKVPPDRRKQAAPTERGNLFEKKMCQKEHFAASSRFGWRQAIIQGETHDANSFHFGGCAGNAGLFSTVADVFKICREFFPTQASILKPESINLFWTNFTKRYRIHRSAGFKLNSSWLTSGGKALSPEAIGHNGFTGTSIWLEPGPENVFVLLSNRIHPEVRPMGFDKIRRKLHKLLKQDLNLK